MAARIAVRLLACHTARSCPHHEHDAGHRTTDQKPARTNAEDAGAKAYKPPVRSLANALCPTYIIAGLGHADALKTGKSDFDLGLALGLLLIAFIVDLP